MIINLKKYRKNRSLLNLNFKGVPLLKFMKILFMTFYSDSYIPKNMINKWNPIFSWDFGSLFDPYMMGPSDAIRELKEAWQPWPNFNGPDRTDIFMDWVTYLINKGGYLHDQKPTIIKGEIYQNIVFNHYMNTIESYNNDNDRIWNIMDINKRTYKRIHLINIKRICELIQPYYTSFNRLLQNPKRKGKFIDNIVKKNVFNSKDLRNEINTLIKDGMSIEIQDPNIQIILERLGFLNKNIISITTDL